MTKFLLDSGDPEEYKQTVNLAKEKGFELWGATTNPSLIAKKLAGKKVSQQEAFELQKQIVMEIIDIIPGAVSAEVYADQETKASEIIEQAEIIAKWHQRVVVKLPTTIEGFKARTQLRRQKIPINNTLVFSQQQIFGICLHEQLTQKAFGPIANLWPPFISPFVGRLDDQGEDGMGLVEKAMKMKNGLEFNCWLLEASVRRTEHIKRGLLAGVEIITSPAKVLWDWFSLFTKQPSDSALGEQETTDLFEYAKSLKPIDYWQPSQELLSISSIDEFTKAIETGKLNIRHDLTDKGVVRFAQDWKSIIKS